MPRSLTTHIDSPTELGHRLRAARERAGMSQRQLAFPGCTAAYISRLEAGARVPSLQMINELAARLGVSSPWLAVGVDAPFSEPTDLLEAEVALRLGDVQEAERLYRARLQPGDLCRPAAIAGLGQIAFRAGDHTNAIALLKEAVDLNGGKAITDPGAVDSLGRAYASAGSRELAIALFESAVTECKAADAPLEQLRFSILLANALIDNGAFADAERTLAEVIQIAERLPDPIMSARVLWSQSRLHGLRGEAPLAAKYARRALDILERTEQTTYVGMAYHLLAFAEIESGQGDQALETLARGRALFGGELTKAGDARFSIEEARALVLTGQVNEAARAASVAFELVDELSPGDRGGAYVALGDVFRASGDLGRARMLYEQGLELVLEHNRGRALEAGRKYADLLEADGDTAGALRVLRLATDLSPAQATVRPA